MDLSEDLLRRIQQGLTQTGGAYYLDPATGRYIMPEYEVSSGPGGEAGAGQETRSLRGYGSYGELNPEDKSKFLKYGADGKFAGEDTYHEGDGGMGLLLPALLAMGGMAAFLPGGFAAGAAAGGGAAGAGAAGAMGPVTAAEAAAQSAALHASLAPYAAGAAGGAAAGAMGPMTAGETAAANAALESSLAPYASAGGTAASTAASSSTGSMGPPTAAEAAAQNAALQSTLAPYETSGIGSFLRNYGKPLAGAAATFADKGEHSAERRMDPRMDSFLYEALAPQVRGLLESQSPGVQEDSEETRRRARGLLAAGVAPNSFEYFRTR